MDAFDWILQARFQGKKYPGKQRLELVHFDRGFVFASDGKVLRAVYLGRDEVRHPQSMTLEQFNLYRMMGVVTPDLPNLVPNWGKVIQKAKEGKMQATYVEHSGGYIEVTLKE